MRCGRFTRGAGDGFPVYVTARRAEWAPVSLLAGWEEKHGLHVGDIIRGVIHPRRAAHNLIHDLLRS